MPFNVFLFLVIILSCLSGQAGAQDQKKFAVLPFEVHGPQEYQYLSQGIQSMLSSRLTRSGLSSSIPPGEVNRQVSRQPETPGQANELRSLLGADFLVYGTVTIMDREASLDVHTAAADRTIEPVLKQPALSQLIPSLEEVAAQLVSQTMRQAEARLEPQRVEPQPVRAAPVQEAETYLAPHFRLEDDPYAAGRWRSQTLPFSSVGIALGSDSGNLPTVFILGDNTVHAYRLRENRLMPLARYDVPRTYQCLTINTLDLNRDGSQEIIVSAVQDNRARSFILSFENDKFNVLHERIPFFINVGHTPPDFRPRLIGQRPATGGRLFHPGSVQEVIMTSAGPELGPRLSLPDTANIFNFTYLPHDNSHLVVVARDDRLRVYNAGHNRMYTTSDEYSGSRLSLEKDSSMPGLASPLDEPEEYYYIPTRLLPIRFGAEPGYTLLAHKHYAGVSRIIASMRNFPEGEIRALFWDDIGLNVRWSTRKIRAGIMDFGVYDFDGDGSDELVVLLNTHPGITGLQDSHTIVLAYKMDPEAMGRPR